MRSIMRKGQIASFTPIHVFQGDIYIKIFAYILWIQLTTYWMRFQDLFFLYKCGCFHHTYWYVHILGPWTYL